MTKRGIIASFIGFLASFSYLFFFLNANMEKLLDADDSSELILAKILADEGQILTDKWFYSTELRVLNTNLVYSFFFRLSDNWHNVRMASTLVMCVAMLAALYFLMRELGLKDYFFICAMVMTLPFSEEWFDFTQKGAYYYPHITITFLSLGLTEYMYNRAGKKRMWIGAAMLLILAFLAGLGGPRQIVVCYLPLLLAGIIISMTGKNRVYLIASVIAFSGSVAGYYINTSILSRIYDFQTYQVKFHDLSFDRLSTTLYGIIRCFGYAVGPVFSYHSIQNLAGILWLGFAVAAIVYGIKNRRETGSAYYRFSVLTAAAFLVYIGFYYFSDSLHQYRYPILILILTVPCLALFTADMCAKDKRICPVMTALVLLVAVGGVGYYAGDGRKDRTPELRKIASFLVQNEYDQGYATFWNANIVTELSNGAVEVWDWRAGYGALGSIDEVYEWLQYKSHVYDHPAGKVFWLLNQNEKEKFAFVKRVPDSYIVYETPEELNWDVLDSRDKTERFFVYGFSDYYEMYELAGQYVNSKKNVIKAGESVSLVNETFYPDVYTVICAGSNLMDCDFDVTYNTVRKNAENRNVTWNRPHDASTEYETKTQESVIMRFEMPVIAKNLKLNVSNPTNEETVITEIKIIKNAN